MINPIWLRTFTTLVQQGHFTKTAHVLAMTQPGVSQHIQKLENYYDTELLNRQGKQFELTPAGEQVYQFALNLLRSEQDLKEQLLNDHPCKGLCRLSSPGALGIRCYTQLVSLQQNHRDLEIHYEIAPNHRIETELLEHRTDLGLMTCEPRSGLLSATAVSREELYLVIPASKVPARTYSDLAKLGMISHPDASHHTTMVMQNNFPDDIHNLPDLRVSGYVNQINIILYPVAAGLGFTVLPASVVQAFPDKDKIHALTLPNPVFETIYLVEKKYRQLPARYRFIRQKIEEILGTRSLSDLADRSEKKTGLRQF
ncbi:LysR family transcriptional regulator [Endozoicomonas montiporae CL-33]|uniref:LysR family transcriptional regulator n=1 Tax=Endozoicomonas montiporae CL-33 TaxID=570277 RepID=A0A142B809_9GAMM|nr:LysR family transcriptional regulator [Endozoicomonas montiporae]AMO54885.1 LysR family transcriptional regulator [Endozoicomonas montiporae CL-33]